MASASISDIRRVVPRWRAFRRSLAAGELDLTDLKTQNRIEGGEFLLEKEAEWLHNKELLFATDLVGAAHVLGPSAVAKEAAEFVLANAGRTSALAVQLATSLLGITIPTNPLILTSDLTNDIRLNIAALKVRRKEEPRNAFVWADLARLYVLLGLSQQAKTPLRIALALAPFDRFIIRSVVRFHLHDGDADRALDLLRKTDRTRSDPWLLAAELAVSHVAGRPPRYSKNAELLIRSNSLPPFHVSELKTALASLKLWEGKNRAAKKLFLESLVQPTDNSLAQTVWAAREVGLPPISEENLKVADASEARTLAARNDGKWNTAFQNAKGWIQDEPFSARPYAFASTIASSILGDPIEAEAIARAGLTTNPKHPALINNIAFALVHQNQPLLAKGELQKADPQNIDEAPGICLLATDGLIEYRLGNQENGKRLYERAINRAEKMASDNLKCLAQSYMACEEVRIGNAEYLSVFQRAYSSALKAGNPQTIAIVEVVRAEIERIIKRLESRLPGF